MLTRERLLETVRGDEATVTERTVDTFIKQLRKVDPDFDASVGDGTGGVGGGSHGATAVIRAAARLLCSLSTGRDPARRDTYVDILFMGLKGGSGATADGDGYDHIGMIDASGGVLDQDYEMFEQMTPHRLEKHEYLCDSAGAGRTRGGLGVETRYLVGGEDTQIVVFGDGDVEPAFGLMGGGPGSLNAIKLHYADGRVYRPRSKDIVAGVPAGTRYVQQAGGGGGFGPPAERPAETVRAEVEAGIVSVAAARETYRVAVDPRTFALDAEETARLRGR